VFIQHLLQNIRGTEATQKATGTAPTPRKRSSGDKVNDSSIKEDGISNGSMCLIGVHKIEYFVRPGGSKASLSNTVFGIWQPARMKSPTSP
jgi:hypothetical protein